MNEQQWKIFCRFMKVMMDFSASAMNVTTNDYSELYTDLQKEVDKEHKEPNLGPR